jgi:hypothetical protein
MNETMMSVMKSSMEKCTTEQFWAVAVVLGFNSFFIANCQRITMVGLTILPLTIVAVSALFLCFVWDRALHHRKLARTFYKVLEKERDQLHEEILKEFEVDDEGLFKRHSGSLLFTAVILISSTASILLVVL